MSLFQRLRDSLYAGFFLLNFLTSVLVDAQHVFDRKLFPKVLIDAVDQFVLQYKDPLTGNPPAWFKGSLHLEIFFQVPLLVVLFFGFLAGARWMRTPTIIYATTVITFLFPMIFHLLLVDFKGQLGPQTNSERLPLLGLYVGYWLIGLIILLDYAIFRPQPSKESYSEEKNNSSQRIDAVKEKKRI